MAARRGTLFQREPALPPLARRMVVASVLGVHVAAAWGLLQAPSVRQAAIEAAPLFVSLVATPAPPQPQPVPPAPQPRRPSAPPQRAEATPPAGPVPQMPSVSAPAVEPELALPSLAYSQPVALAPTASVAPPAAQPVPVPATPRAVPSTAVRYVVEPEPAYPSTSRRLGEAGEVRLRVEIGTDGRARHVSVHHSSGFPRLDESAITAVRAARFAPYTEHGVALVVWTIVPVAFELQS
jgi:periplasmic protein TonB